VFLESWEERCTDNSRRWCTCTRYELPATPKTRSPTVFSHVPGTTRLLADDDLSCLRESLSAAVRVLSNSVMNWERKTLETVSSWAYYELKLTKTKRHKTSLIPHTLTLQLWNWLIAVASAADQSAYRQEWPSAVLNTNVAPLNDWHSDITYRPIMLSSPVARRDATTPRGSLNRWITLKSGSAASKASMLVIWARTVLAARNDERKQADRRFGTHFAITCTDRTDYINFLVHFIRFSLPHFHLAKKSSSNTNRKPTMRFPMSLRWSSYIVPKPPKGGLKNAKRPICVKNRTSLEESLLQSFFVWKLSAAKL